MARRARHSARAARPWIEPLEARELLSMTQPWGASSGPAVPASQTLLVRFQDGTTERQIRNVINRLDATVVADFDDGPMALSLPSQSARDSALRRLSGLSFVVYVEENAPLQTQALATPNDPSYRQLWGLNNNNDVDVDAPEGWSINASPSSAGAGVIVAVIDTGIDLNHPDLAGRIYVNMSEIAGNGVDDDRNGYVDDVNGWNFVARNGNVQDDNGHGTHVSGTIAANANNGVGIAGVAPGATIMPLKVLDASGGGSTLDAVSAIYYAAARGARVINASWGGPGYSQSMADAIRAVGQAGTVYGGGRGSVFVAAAGNEGSNNDTAGSYPANNRFGTTLSVAAVDSSGRLASFSNIGASTVDLAAPGVNIVSTVPGGYSTYSGTSMATPHVAGVAALTIAQNPSATAVQIVQRLVSTTKSLSALAGKTITGGLVSASRALGVASGGTTTTPPASGGTSTPTNPTPAPANPATPAPTPSPTPPQVFNAPDHIRAAILASDEYYANSGNTDTAFIRALYRSALGREAAAVEVSFWYTILRSNSRFAVAQGIVTSPEGLRTKVARWYMADLGRTSTLAELKDDGGVGYWASQMAAGLSDTIVRAAILSSDEYFQRMGGTYNGFLTAAYPATLARSASSTEQTNALTWLRAGYSRYDVAVALLTSGESRRTLVAGYYQNDLQRRGTLSSLKNDPGVQYWAGFITV